MTEEKQTVGNGSGGDIPLDFEAWANLSARLMKRGTKEQDDLLAERKIDPEDWKRYDSHYTDVLSEDIKEADGKLAQRYGATCAEELERRRTEKHAASPEPDNPAIDADQAQPEPVAAERPPASQQLPTYLLRERASAATGVARPPVALSSTMALQDLPLSARAAAAAPLPFGAEPSSELSQGTKAENRAPPSIASGFTMGLGTDLTAHIKAALPFAGQGGARPASAPAETRCDTFPRLPLEAYASLCAELSAFPDNAEQILKKYNVTSDSMRRALDQDWQTRLAAQPETQQKWRELYARYRAWLLQSRT